MSLIKIGFDKIDLYSFRLIDIDYNYLRSLDSQGHNIIIRRDLQHDYVRYLKICDNNLFNDLVITCSVGEQYYKRSIHLTLSPTNVLGNNEYNLNWSECNVTLQRVLAYIEAKYHIVLDDTDAKMCYAELNTNVLISGKCVDYDRVIKLMVSFLPSRLLRADWPVRKDSKKKTDDSLTYSASNKQMAISIYNKSAQLKAKGEDVADDSQTLLRIEIKLKTSKKIASILGSNKWHELSDGNIAVHYHGMVNELIFGKFDEWQADRKRDIKGILGDYRREYPREWQFRVMQYIRNESERLGVPYILDIEQIVEALRELPDKNRNNHRHVQALMNTRTPNDVYFNNDVAKWNEIVAGINAAYEASIRVAE